MAHGARRTPHHTTPHSTQRVTNPSSKPQGDEHGKRSYRWLHDFSPDRLTSQTWLSYRFSGYTERTAGLDNLHPVMYEGLSADSAVHSDIAQSDNPNCLSPSPARMKSKHDITADVGRMFVYVGW
jgi:hypothetical protein